MLGLYNSKRVVDNRNEDEGRARSMTPLVGRVILARGIPTTDRFVLMTAYVCLGSNLGDRAGYLLMAVRGMMNAGLSIQRLSSVYETEPVDVCEQPLFLNMVAELAGALPAPEQMLARLLRIEYALGRRRDVARGPRTIDLDLLLYGERQINSQFLTLPHPRLHERRFVLTPLAEIAPKLVHPIFHRTISELLVATEDSSAVKRWTPEETMNAER